MDSFYLPLNQNDAVVINATEVSTLTDLIALCSMHSYFQGSSTYVGREMLLDGKTSYEDAVSEAKKAHDAYVNFDADSDMHKFEYLSKEYTKKRLVAMRLKYNIWNDDPVEAWAAIGLRMSDELIGKKKRLPTPLRRAAAVDSVKPNITLLLSQLRTLAENPEYTFPLEVNWQSPDSFTLKLVFNKIADLVKVSNIELGDISDEKFLEASQKDTSSSTSYLSEALSRLVEYGKLARSSNSEDNIETLMASVSEGRGLLKDNIKPLTYFMII